MWGWERWDPWGCGRTRGLAGWWCPQLASLPLCCGCMGVLLSAAHVVYTASLFCENAAQFTGLKQQVKAWGSEYRNNLTKQTRVILHSPHTHTVQFLQELWMLKVYMSSESNWVNSWQGRTPSSAEKIFRGRYPLYASSDLILPVCHWLAVIIKQIPGSL